MHYMPMWSLSNHQVDGRFVCSGLGIFLFTTVSRPALGPTHPPIQWVLKGSFPGVRQPDLEADHSPPSSAAVKNAWSYTSTPQYVFMALCSIKAQGQLSFTFTFTLINLISL